MRAVVQRVSRAKVEIAGQIAAEIGPGLLVLLGVAKGDSEADAVYLAGKTAQLRIFPDVEGKMNLSLLEHGGEALVVSQFTLYGDCRKGRRPSFDAAAPPAVAKPLYECFASRLAETGLRVATGVFQADMLVSLVNDGPVTLILESA